ncbi:hypothetical protein [Pseudomonas luteola]|uniref:hypothetical protein n=1 Tax=Pseudomonas luteola TaxID=47886 RepID=UPI0028A26328|nr:hypothetical protein [Pseudomonas luteola]
MNETFEQRVEATTRMLISACQERDIRLAGDMAVSEAAAAELLGYSSADSLRKQVAEGVNRLPFRTIGNRRMYRITDIAKEMERTYG